MAARIVIDPVTRIEGHLRLEAEIRGGKVVDAYSSGTMVRMIEKIMKGRDPRDVWAFAGRVCGVCTAVHSLASCRAVEDALDIIVPPNAELVRNIMSCVQYMHDHVVHFYQLHALDWVDIIDALQADPKQASEIAQSISKWPKNSAGYFSDAQKRIRQLVESGQLGLFTNGYWGHPAYKLPAEINLIGLVHYLEALEWQKEIVKVHAIFGGKNPHPNYLVGGMACVIGLDDATALNAERLAYVGTLLDEGKQFIEQVYLPDLLAIARFYPDWGHIGKGLGNYLVYGDFPTNGYRDDGSYKIPAGAILEFNPDEVLEVNLREDTEIQEFIGRSWYTYSNDQKAGLHPWKGETEVRYTGPKPPYNQLNVDEQYSFLKTPRWKGCPMEVGPLARMMVGYASGREEYIHALDKLVTELNIPFSALSSTLGRTASRGLETGLIANWGIEFYDQLISNIRSGNIRMARVTAFNPKYWKKECQGVGHMEAPRGALGHWVVIKNKKVENYQMVVPTTWNASPRDIQGNMSAYESALIDTPVAREDQPLEILRTIHSFDPCIACAVHLYDEHGSTLSRVSIL